jgi:mitotic spindle assembly checkpoint protein MAD2
MSNTINRLVLAITSKETLETLERWQFDIIREDDDSTPVTSSTVPQGSTINGLKPGGKAKEKTEKEVQGEIREIMKQITASVTFLPTLEEECKSTFSPIIHFQHSHLCFNPHLFLASTNRSPRTGSFTLLAYTSTSDPLPLPEKWNDADPHLIEKGKVEQVRLRSFSTNVHKMEVSPTRCVRRGVFADHALRCVGDGCVQDRRVVFEAGCILVGQTTSVRI